MTKDVRFRMSRKHEEYICDLLGARRTKASGSQWNNPTDGRMDSHVDHYAFAFDGKATFAKSHSIPLTMWQKVKEQAYPEEPMLALRYYDPDAGDMNLKPVLDLVVVEANLFSGILSDANFSQSKQDDYR